MKAKAIQQIQKIVFFNLGQGGITHDFEEP